MLIHSKQSQNSDQIQSYRQTNQHSSEVTSQAQIIDKVDNADKTTEKKQSMPLNNFKESTKVLSPKILYKK